MKRVIEVEMETTAKKFETALNRFFKKHTELEYWKETFEYMYENGIDFFCDNLNGDGTKNNEWAYALHHDINERCSSGGYDFYFCIIERA